jgi:hypothetical protein
MKAEAEQQSETSAEPQKQAEPTAGSSAEASKPSTRPEAPAGPRLVSNPPARKEAAEPAAEAEGRPGMPPAPTAEESQEQKDAYEASAQRLEDLVRAQNPGAGAPPPVSFDNLVQQIYVSALIQMGAGAQEGQRPQVDILGARSTIDLLGVLAEKTRGNLTAQEERTLQTVLYDLRMAFLELTGMISMPTVPPTTPPAKR